MLLNSESETKCIFLQWRTEKPQIMWVKAKPHLCSSFHKSPLWAHSLIQHIGQSTNSVLYKATNQKTPCTALETLTLIQVNSDWFYVGGFCPLYGLVNTTYIILTPAQMNWTHRHGRKTSAKNSNLEAMCKFVTSKFKKGIKIISWVPMSWVQPPYTSLVFAAALNEISVQLRKSIQYSCVIGECFISYTTERLQHLRWM